MEMTLRHDQAPREYMEGYPIGNGRLAAMVLPTPERTRLALNHEWLYTGVNRYRTLQTVDPAILEQVRALIAREQFAQATALANEHLAGGGGVSGQPNRVDPYVPLGDLIIETPGCQDEGYERALELTTGLAGWTLAGPQGPVAGRAFASSTDGVIALEIQNPPPALTLSLTRAPAPGCVTESSAAGDTLRLDGAYTGGTRFCAVARVQTDGKVFPDGGTIRVEGAGTLRVLVQAGTDAKGGAPEDECRFPDGGLAFDDLLARHTERFCALMGRTALNLALPQSFDTTDRRVKALAAGGDPGLTLLYFNYGWYLLISSSMAELPMSLQGKWNEDMDPPWQCDYHLDINLQMVYWAAGRLALAEMEDPLFAWLERCVPHGREAAKQLYGCRGLYMALQTDVWGRMTPEAKGWAVWIGAAPWLAQHFFRRWQMSGDRDFLRRRAYPFLREVALFYEDYLFEENGALHVSPSQSPENRFEGGGDWPVTLCQDAAMDLTLAKEALTHAAEAAWTLGVDETDGARWQALADGLQPLSVGPDGRLLEWDKPRVELEPGHRHCSHLYGLHPGEAFAPGTALCRAAEKSLDYRLSHGGGHTGWSRSWTACFMARLGRGEDAWRHLTALIADFATTSLLDLHPPRIFQIDGNLGGAAAVTEMLLRDCYGCIHLLPALPAAWPQGSFTGWQARAAVTVDCAWQGGKVISARLTPRIGQTLRVRAEGLTAVTCGGCSVACVSEEGVLVFQGEAGRTYELT